MNPRSEYPYSLLKYGIIRSYPSLKKSFRRKWLIGAGITGASVAWQYEIDTPLYELIKKKRYKNAVRSYHLCRKAIYDPVSCKNKS